MIEIKGYIFKTIVFFQIKTGLVGLLFINLTVFMVYSAPFQQLDQ